VTARSEEPAAATDAAVELSPGPVEEDDAPAREARDPADLEDVVVETSRWQGVAAVALLMGAVGIYLSRPVVLLLAVVPVAYAAYARQGSPPSVSLSVEREFEDESPSPGDDVEVTVAVTNTGSAPLWDLRLVDDVPPGLEVTGGSPRLATALRPGRTARFTYVVTAHGGNHEFDRLEAIVRDLAGTHEVLRTVDTAGVLECLPDVDAASDVPLRAASSRFTGRVPTQTGGEGIEFYATREYRPGDSPTRVDWNRYAATRELATLEFRQERAATVMLLVDAREQAHRAPEEGAESALRRSVEAAAEVFASLQDAGDRVGIVGFGPESCWLPPNAGTGHRERARTLLATHGAFSPEPPGTDYYPRRQLEMVHRRAPVDAQFILFSPVTDDYIATVARRLQAYGHPVTVVSPDVTTSDTVTRRLATVERRVRLNRLRESEVRVVDWRSDELLAVALARASEEWSL
jgi:uncharacterized repeat protein (TIGR01451 family)